MDGYRPNESSKTGAPPPGKTNAAFSILLVDDEAGIRNVLSLSLSDSGYRVVTADNGISAYRMFKESRPQIVLTDIKMPGMTGIELLSKIKKENPDTEVIMISGHGDMDLAIMSLKHDATDFITKPINDDSLEIALKRARERILMRQQLREYTENLEALVKEKTEQLVKAERVAAVSRAVEGLSSTIWNLAGDLNGNIKYFNEMPCLVSVHSPELKLVAANKLFIDRIGDKIGANSWEIYKGASNEPDTCPVRKTFQTGKGLRSSETIEYANGVSTPVIVHTAPVRNRAGKVELVLEISADIEEVKRLEQKLRATQQRYQQLFDAVPCYITVQNRTFNITAMNKEFKQDFDPSLGSFCYEIYKNRKMPCEDCPVEKTFNDGQSHQAEMVVSSKTGDPVNLLISTAPITNEAGEIDQVMELATNITQIRKLQDRLTNLGLKIGTISHGIKGLLTRLDSGIYMVDSGFKKEDKPKITEGWDIVKLTVNRIKNLILDILYYAKERDLTRKPVDIIRFARDVAATIEPKINKQQIEFNCDLDPSLSEVEIDASAVRTALINILENAIEACMEKKSGPDKQISFRVSQNTHDIIFDIIDNGIGMDEETKKNLFTLFFSSKGALGTGFGLFISKNIIQQHGGTIAVTSQKGHGARFCIKIPKTPHQPAAPDKSDPTVGQQRS